MATENTEWGDFGHFKQTSIINSETCEASQGANDSSDTQASDWPKNSTNFLLGVKSSENQTDLEGIKSLSSLTELLTGGLLEECFPVLSGSDGQTREDVKISLVDNDLYVSTPHSSHFNSFI